MTNPNQRLEPFDETFQQPNIHRGKRYGKKKRFSTKCGGYII
ncbi:hypothetical protein V600_01560 [Staphylococcus aureus H81901]|nr:hypothetical protein V274_00830 [Staphylococcus aureus T83715]EWX57892.1 hypothetical protein V350_00854 [Staphylococcus aureus H53188]EYJ81562.1 hypothetical protein V595_01415 [Staphylococcus aureus H43690]EYJ84113.1 hypothetical protein V600_01560 [Staphylococcus aureus H81901]EYL71219.1 hypothetical protein V689_01054 [Staphylococcus aureus H89939]EYL73497.1 hypothetical protein V690_01030 [Staphylococcus aureus H89941]